MRWQLLSGVLDRATVADWDASEASRGEGDRCPPPLFVRLRPDRVEQVVAEEDAKRFAREEQDKLDSQ